MNKNRDFYEVLGVSKNASADEIKRAYRKLALEYHPDRNRTKDASSKFKEVSRAYEVLSDPQKKQAYDQFGHAAFAQEGAGFQGQPFGSSQGGQGQYGPFRYTYYTDFDFGDPFEIFEQFFGGGSPFGQRARRPTYSLTIDFMEAVHGAEKRVTIDNNSQTIKIPAGVDNGSRVRFGDYDVVVEVRPHSKFRREGYDIITGEEISFSQAALGDVIKVETVDGDLDLRVPAGTQPDSVIRLRGKGVPHVHSSGRGDHYVRVKIVVPKHLTRRQKELLEEFENEVKHKRSWF